MFVKRVILVLCMLILLISYPCYAETSGQGRWAIGVVDFLILDPSFSVNASVLTDSMTTMIHKLGRFEVIERGRLSAILDNVGLSMSGIVEASDRTSLGRIKGVDLLVVASVGKLGTDVVVNARFIKLPTGEVVAAEQVRGQSERDLEPMLRQLVGKLQDIFPFEAAIAQVDKDIIYIEAGSSEGLKVGDRLWGFSLAEVRTPSGKVLGYEHILRAELEVIEVYDGFSKLRVLRGQSTDFSAGDVVKSSATPTQIASLNGASGGAKQADSEPPGGPIELIGRIIDAATGQPISGAKVWLADESTMSDHSGAYSIEAGQSGPSTLKVVAPGYVGFEAVVDLKVSKNTYDVSLTRTEDQDKKALASRYFEEGKERYWKKHYREACDLFFKAFDLSPRFWGAYDFFAWSYRRSRDPLASSFAENVSEDVFSKMGDDNPYAHYSAAVIYNTINWDRMVYSQKWFTTVPESIYVRSDSERAVEHAISALALGLDDTAAAHTEYAEALFFKYANNGKFDEVLSEARRALELDPSYFKAYDILLKAYQYVDDPDEILAIGEKALTCARFETGGEQAVLCLYIAYAHIEKGDWREAERFLKAADRLIPNYWDIHGLLARVYYGLGDLYKARYHIKVAEELYGDDLPGLFGKLAGELRP